MWISFRSQTLHRIPELISARRSSGKAQVDISFPEIEKFDHLPAAKVEGVTALVSIRKVAANIAVSALCPIPAVKKLVVF